MDYFFDIPVYRVNQEKYEALQKAHVGKEIATLKESYYVKKMYDEDPKEAEKMRRHLWKRDGGFWQFNEIIGYIRLYFYGEQIRGEWWKVEGKANRKSRTKRFEYREHKVVHEEFIERGSTRQQIYESIRAYLARAQQDKYLKDFYVDTSVFERVGPHVDWLSAFKALDFFRPNKDKEENRPTVPPTKRNWKI